MQLSFSFQSDLSQNIFKEEDFLLMPENSKAFDFSKNFFAQKDYNSSRPSSFILLGEEKSGKTHLLNIFAKKYGAEFLNDQAIKNDNISNFFHKNHFYILEKIDEIGEEELLLHIINCASESGAFLVMSGNFLPKFHLKDLSSRFKNIATVKIENFGEDSLKLILLSLLSRQQIKVSKTVINYVISRIERSCKAIYDMAKFLEILTYEKGSALNLRDITKQESILSFSSQTTRSHAELVKA